MRLAWQASLRQVSLTDRLNTYQYAPNPTGCLDPLGLAKIFDQSVNRWRNTQTGRFATRPDNPAELMINNGRINQLNINAWADQKQLPNIFVSNEKRFPEGVFKYTDGKYTIHGHGADARSQDRFPGSNSANGPTASIQDRDLKGMRAGSSGEFINFEGNTNRNDCHIPLDGFRRST